MAQHDLNIANQSFPSFRSDLNNALSAIQTTHSGTSRPTGAVAGQIWLDTTSATSPTLKYYDGADDISLATIDHSANTVNWLDSTVSITGLTTTATGTVLTLTDTHLNSTVSIRIPTTKGIDDDSGNEFLKFTKTASAVNEFTIINSATGSAPEIQSTGDDTNIDLKITPKGTGKIILDGLAFPNADGSANQVLQTNGSGVLSFSSVSSDYVRLATSTITANTASVTFDGYFSSTYDTYVIYGNNIYTDSNAVFVLLLRQSGSNLTANTYFYSGYDVNSSNASQVHFDHPSSSIGMNRVTTSTSANYNNSFQVILFDPNNNQGSHYAEYYSNIFYTRNDGYMSNTYLSGNYSNVSTAITGFQIKPSTGNFDTGTIVLYGVKK